jgi:hypothetical protein
MSVSNHYDKIESYIKSVFNVFQMVKRSADQHDDKKRKMIALIIYNYAQFMSKEYDVDLREVGEPEMLNLIPIFEYIAANNVQLYDFATIGIEDVDIRKREDLERFVLSHVYYITQGSK